MAISTKYSNTVGTGVGKLYQSYSITLALAGACNRRRTLFRHVIALGCVQTTPPFGSQTRHAPAHARHTPARSNMHGWVTLGLGSIPWPAPELGVCLGWDGTIDHDEVHPNNKPVLATTPLHHCASIHTENRTTKHPHAY